MIDVDMIRNPNTINIFTDASTITHPNNITDACYGAIVIHEDKEINSKLYIDSNTTVNRAEIKGIRTGISEAISLRMSGFTGVINIFSDSQISIFGIRDWIFNWRPKNINGQIVLTGYSNKEVANQDIYLEIMYMIVDSGLSVNLYHQKGHVDIYKKKDVFRGAHVFSASNHIRDEISMNFIEYISFYNNEIDIRSRFHLKKQADLSMNYIDPFKFVVPEYGYNTQLQQYNQLTGGRF